MKFNFLVDFLDYYFEVTYFDVRKLKKIRKVNEKLATENKISKCQVSFDFQQKYFHQCI